MIIESEYSKFIFELLSNSNLFKSIDLDYKIGDFYRPDIVAVREINSIDEYLIIEIKTKSSYTNHNLLNIVQQLKSYQKVLPNAKLAFVFPGEISNDSRHILEDNGIDVWDIPFISNFFSKEIVLSSYSNFMEIYSKQNSNYVQIADTKCFMGSSKINDADKFINELQAMPSGKVNWSDYQKLIKNILDFLFSDSLSNSIEESSDLFRVNRRDFILRNYAEHGFWARIRHRYLADFIVIDAKNYSKAVTKNEILQVSNYLKAHGTGLFGIIISRKGGSKNSIHTRREIWGIDNKLVLLLDDNHIINMLLAKKNGSDIEEIIQQEIETFRLSI